MKLPDTNWCIQCRYCRDYTLLIRDYSLLISRLFITYSRLLMTYYWDYSLLSLKITHYLFLKLLMTYSWDYSLLIFENTHYLLLRSLMTYSWDYSLLTFETAKLWVQATNIVCVKLYAFFGFFILFIFYKPFF